jgi:hypothetical protein
MLEVPKNHPMTNWTEQEFLAAAHHLGYNPNKIKFISELTEEMKRALGEIDLLSSDCPAMLTDLRKGDIYVFKHRVPKDFERGLLAHEIFHAAFKASLDAFLEQSETGTGHLIGRFADTLGKPENLADIGYVTNYAAFYLQRVLDAMVKYDSEVFDSGGFVNNEFALCVTETLSEMARVREQEGFLPNTKIWRNLYRNIELTAVELGVIKK